MDAGAMLSSLAVLSARTEAAEENILRAAESRLEASAKELQELVPRVFVDQQAADQYMRIVEERGRLSRVIELANDRLAAATSRKSAAKQK